MITFPNFNHHGVRTGNHLFQYATLLALAHRFKTELQIPEYKYSKYFRWFPDKISVETDIKLILPTQPVCYVRDQLDKFMYQNKDRNVEVDWIWGQSYRNWDDCEDFIKNKLEIWNGRLFDKIFFKTEPNWMTILSQGATAISIRRGDYVGHSMFYQLDKQWYLDAIQKMESIVGKTPIIFFSDNIEWCKKEFKDIPDTYFANGNFTDKNYFNDPFEQLYLMTRCSNYIISNSTFSWWGAYLSQNRRAVVIRPDKHLSDGHNLDFIMDDYYPKEWLIQKT